jgi:hypothetical protein
MKTIFYFLCCLLLYLFYYFFLALYLKQKLCCLMDNHSVCDNQIIPGLTIRKKIWLGFIGFHIFGDVLHTIFFVESILSWSHTTQWSCQIETYKCTVSLLPFKFGIRSLWMKLIEHRLLVFTIREHYFVETVVFGGRKNNVRSWVKLNG